MPRMSIRCCATSRISSATSRTTLNPTSDRFRRVTLNGLRGTLMVETLDALKGGGFQPLLNLEKSYDGGINAWAERVDPKVPKFRSIEGRSVFHFQFYS